MSDTIRPLETAAPVDLDKPPLHLVPELPADPAGDLPLVPAWTRNSDGRKAAARRAARRVRRTGRRWISRQRTDRGHAAQIARGTRRTHEWVVGFQGVSVQAAAHQAHLATREARDAARRARYTIMPGQRDKARQAADRAQTQAMAAVQLHEQARRKVRRGRIFRGAAAYGTPLLVDTAALVEFGGLGLAGGVFATLSAAAWIGRKPLTAETWDHERRTIGDGDAMNEPMLNRAYQDAKVIPADQELKLVTPCMLTADGQAWSAVFDLPSGLPTKKALNAKESIAGALGVAVQQLHQSRGDREGRVHLRVSLALPFTGEPVQGPLLAMDRANLWQPIPMGVNLRGESVWTSWVERSGLFGGEPGSGKSAAANDLLLAAALDPTVRLYLADGKAGADITPYEPIAAMFDTNGDPEKLLEILRHIWNVEIPQRRALAKEHGSRKLTAEMAARDPRVCLAVLLVDEWSSYGAAAEKKTRDELERLLRLIVQQGRALGVITLAATQKPDSDSVPTGIRDILSIRWAMRCLTPQASDTILGQGYASAGHNAQEILKSQRGVGIYMDGEGAEPDLTLSYYYDDDEVELILDRAYKLRAEAGTLPGSGPTLADQLRDRGTDGKILAALVDEFTAHDEDWLPGSILLTALKAAGLDVTPERLAALVVRPDADKKRTWEGSRVSGYARDLVLDTATQHLDRT
ncbi:DNA translocase SpoIIIE [Streptomyces sp. 111WW2]|uniref:FtsK/SpoIIIE domain-containing protein n=1 Tax=Streptomyces sp. 111WW2 TaxID=1945515 RepID=UPI000D0C7EF7|nr:FtsK/SpoIIIE domain-containing protein [Streptomyces sp. 111WW2]PSK47986.1 DNA translocase SpoIIIE [Streptomyces sp. 111WW2]